MNNSTPTLAASSTCPDCGIPVQCGALQGDNSAACWCLSYPVVPTATIDTAQTCACSFCLMAKTVSPLFSRDKNGSIAGVIDLQLNQAIDKKIASKTMPSGALGRIIELAKRLCLVQNTLTPNVEQAHFWVFAGDHGLAREGVSAYPQDVTWQMVENFLSGGAAINVFARTLGVELAIVNAGVAHDFGTRPNLIHAAFGPGTASSLHGPAMTVQTARDACIAGYHLLTQSQAQVVGFGEMGIGNSSAAALLTSLLCDVSIDDCVGPGTGVNDEQLSQKKRILKTVYERHSGLLKNGSAIELLSAVGGYEIAMMTGAILGAAATRKLILIDGYIATSAALVAQALAPSSMDYCVFAHASAEPGHRFALQKVKQMALLDLQLRLGEGSGAVLAVPLVRCAAAMMNEMASFDSAQVSQAQ
jgi:nicotinate-nucleotide--dimethylbenzimidazole phosphoribosyltransferase